ncbi:MAG: SMI1/KNR4 family protein [Planctomycetota bacterium]
MTQLHAPKEVKRLTKRSREKMTKKLWIALQASWDWTCDAAADREKAYVVRPEIHNPIDATQLEDLRQIVGHALPTEFERVLCKFASKVSFSWSFDIRARSKSGRTQETIVSSPPEWIDDCLMGGGDLWDIAYIERAAKDAKESEGIAEWLQFSENRFALLPFIEVPNGDAIAFDMRGGEHYCPIVYLSHDDYDLYDVKIGENFVDFLANWSSVGCVGPDFYCFKPFYKKWCSKLIGSSRKAKSWRKFMGMETDANAANSP